MVWDKSNKDTNGIKLFDEDRHLSMQMIQYDNFYSVVMDKEKNDEDLTIPGDRNNFDNAGSHTGALFLAPWIHLWE